MIRLRNVTKHYSAEVTALRDASFDIAKAEFVFLVGPSGSGKSTLLRLMNRQERPERGSVWVAGRDINEMPDSKIPHLRRNIGNIFQDYKLLPNRTVFENVAFALEVIGRPRHQIRQQVPAVLDLVGLGGCRAVSSSASRSPARSSTDRSSCSPTSRPAISTRQRVRASCGCSTASTRQVRPW